MKPHPTVGTFVWFIASMDLFMGNKTSLLFKRTKMKTKMKTKINKKRLEFFKYFITYFGG